MLKLLQSVLLVPPAEPHERGQAVHSKLGTGLEYVAAHRIRLSCEFRHLPWARDHGFT